MIIQIKGIERNGFTLWKFHLSDAPIIECILYALWNIQHDWRTYNDSVHKLKENYPKTFKNMNIQARLDLKYEIIIKTKWKDDRLKIDRKEKKDDERL